MSDQTILDQLRTVRGQVASILERYPASRNSDTYLEWLWLKERLAEKAISLPYLPFEMFHKLNFESVRRCRQLLQSQGLYPPSSEVAIARRRKESAIRQWATRA